MKGWCLFELNESRDAGDIKMDLIFNKPTRNLQIWIMNIDKTLNRGRAYELSNKYPYSNTMLKVEFILTYRGGKKKFPRGRCISNITPPSTTTQMPTTHASVTPQASTTSVTQQPTTTSEPRFSTTTIPESFPDVIPISVEGQHWSVGNGYRMTGVCIFQIKPVLNSYNIMVEFDKETYDMTEWTMDIEDQQLNGLWYYLKSRWPERQNEIRLRFQVDFDSLPVPSGTCTIDRNGQTLTPKPSTAMPTPTTKAPTQQPSTAAPTQKPSTAAPTQQPSTAAPTQQPSTAAPTQQPSTAAPTQQPSTAAPTQQPSTTAPTQQPSTTQAPTGAPVNTAHDYGFILHESILFYEAQQAGYLTNNRVSWRKNATTLDRGIYGEDLTGGWYDAGDLVNFNLPMAGSTTNLALGLFYWKDAYQQAGELDNMYNSIKWPLDYFLKCWNPNKQIYYAQVGNGEQDHSLWRRAEDITTARPVYYLDTNKKGSDVVGETVAAMAAGAMVFKDKDAAYSQKLQSSAESLYSFSKTIKGLYNNDISDGAKFYSSSRYQDEMCTSATLLYLLTNDAAYLTEAEAAYNEYASDSAPWAFDWDDKTALCQVLLYVATQKPVYKSRTEKFVTSYMPGGSLPYTNCGLAFRLEWGSLRYSANAAFISLLAAQNGIGNADSYKTWAMSQIHYMVGDNNRDFSYLIGYGTSYPLKPHHSGSSCSPAPAPCDWSTYGSSDPNPNVLRGALVGGPDINDNYVDDRNNFKTNEVTCDYNAGFQSAVAGLLHFALNGNLPTSPARKC
ncbi:uncharacterized protein LOC133182894 [Saccostrea echinata]|uniref:uncharacterized protein LOC133182894 n=1 Tax=Saccostrea echinata TaxID=191078 RepID=UPI002A823449|nr:uncharacterized protein LOC133182894 [Saccostrea echinata]